MFEQLEFLQSSHFDCSADMWWSKLPFVLKIISFAMFLFHEVSVKTGCLFMSQKESGTRNKHHPLPQCIYMGLNMFLHLKVGLPGVER